jgi:hypothetical protein
MRKWRRWRALSPSDRWLLLRACVLLLRARCALPYMTFRSAADCGPTPDASEAMPERQHATRVAALVRIAAANLPLRNSCLPRALVTWTLLRRDGIACELRLGARAGHAPFEAHAWVDCGGTALGEDPVTLARLRPFGRPVVPARAWTALPRRAVGVHVTRRSPRRGIGPGTGS